MSGREPRSGARTDGTEVKTLGHPDKGDSVDGGHVTREVRAHAKREAMDGGLTEEVRADGRRWTKVKISTKIVTVDETNEVYLGRNLCQKRLR